MESVENATPTNQTNTICTTTSLIVNPSKCKRVGCQNPSIDHPEWDGEYCSAQCLSIYCKEAFAQWVKKYQ